MMPFTPKLPQQLKLEPCYKLLHSTPMPDMTEDLEDVHNQETEEILDQIAALLEYLIFYIKTVPIKVSMKHLISLENWNDLTITIM